VCWQAAAALGDGPHAGVVVAAWLLHWEPHPEHKACPKHTRQARRDGPPNITTSCSRHRSSRGVVGNDTIANVSASASCGTQNQRTALHRSCMLVLSACACAVAYTGQNVARAGAEESANYTCCWLSQQHLIFTPAVNSCHYCWHCHC
jgi:hypothetical protein